MRLLAFAASRGDGSPIDHVVRDFQVLNPSSRSQAINTLNLLRAYGLLTLEAEQVSVTAVGVSSRARDEIETRLVYDLSKRLSRAGAWRCVQRDPYSPSLTIDHMTMPGCDDGIAKWLIEFGVAVRTDPEARYWSVGGTHAQILMSEVMRQNEGKVRNGRSIERLRADLEKQTRDGEAAEIWVLEYERQRLASHPFVEQVRKVSGDDVSAGYDLVSFATEISLEHDRFIEVKSHGAQKRFYWSRNEISIAEELGEKYALYLVDRTRCHDPNYHPHIITGPTLDMFKGPRSPWSISATSFEMILRQPSPPPPA